MIFRNGYPSVITGEYGYFQAIQRMGFRTAHRQMLEETKTWLQVNRANYSVFMQAVEAYQIHQSFLKLVFSSSTHGATIQEMDRIFAEVFGRSGRAIIEGAVPQASFMTENAMGNWTLPRRVRAKSRVVNRIRSN